MKLRIALGHVESKFCDLAANVDRHIDYIRRARDAGAHIIVLPEISLTGYFLRAAVPDAAATIDDERIKRLVQSADDICVVAGMVEEAEGHLFYNSALVINDRMVTGVHRKLFLPDYGMFEEGRYFAAGSEANAFELPWGTAGILICEDAWHPRIALNLAEKGISLYIYISASPVKGVNTRDGIVNREINEGIAKFYAGIFGIPVVFVNKVGFEQGVRFWGGSTVFDPGGSCVVSCPVNTEELAYADVDLDQIRRSHVSFPYLRDELARRKF